MFNWLLNLFKTEKPPLDEAFIEEVLSKHVDFYQELPSVDTKQKFLSRIQKFIQHKEIVAVRGHQIDDEIRVLVASSAIIPLFNFKAYYYPNLKWIKVAPRAFNFKLQSFGVNRYMLGAYFFGRKEIIISEEALKSGFKYKKDGKNTGVHEFMHAIDGMDGKVDGVPEVLLKKHNANQFAQVLNKDMHRLKRISSKSGFDNYGATNIQEFFAVTSTYYFENPEKLQKKFPDTYKLLEETFK